MQDQNGFDVVTDSPATKDPNGFHVVAHSGVDTNGFEVVHPGGIQKMNRTEEGLQGKEPGNAQPIGLLEGAQNVLENVFSHAFAERDIMGNPVIRKPSFVIDQNQGTISQGPPELSRPTPGVPMIQPNPMGYDEQGKAIYAPFNRLLMAASTPGNVGVLPFAGGEGMLARALGGYFAAQGGMGTYQAGKTLLTSNDPQARHEAVEDLPLNLLMAAGGTHHMLHEARLPGQPNFPDASTQHPVEGGSAGSYNQILSRIAQNKDSRFSGLAQQWLDSKRSTELMNKQVTVDPNLDRAGAYDPNSGASVHPSMVNNDFVMLHEIGHGLTEERLNNPELSGMLGQLYDTAKVSLGEDGTKLHGMKNLDEFTTEALTNPSFQQSLKFARAGDRSVFDRFIDLAMSAVGRAREKGSLLEKVRTAANGLVEGKGQDLQLPERSTSEWNKPTYEPPRAPSFYAGPGGVAEAPLRPQDQFAVQQQPQRKLLGYNPPEVQGPQAPPEPGRFVAGPTGVAQEPMLPQERYQVEQPRQVKGLIGDASYKFGPTTMRQTLANAEAQLKGEPVEKPLPGTKRLESGFNRDENGRPKFPQTLEDIQKLMDGLKKPVADQGDARGSAIARNVYRRNMQHLQNAYDYQKSKLDEWDAKNGKLESGVGKNNYDSLVQQMRDEKDPAKRMALWQKIEDVKNKTGGMPPVKPEDKKPLNSGVQLPEQDLNDFSLTASRLLRNPDKLKFHTQTGDVDGGQLVNRLMNLVPPAEKDLLEKQGIREQFPAGKKTNIKDVDKWVQENGPKTEVKVLKSGTAKDEKEKMYAEAQHELETAGYRLGEPHPTDDVPILMKDGRPVSREELDLLPKRLQEAYANVELAITGAEEWAPKSGFDPDVYRSIAPKDKDQTVVMVRVPKEVTTDRTAKQKGYAAQGEMQRDEGTGEYYHKTYEGPNLHQGNHFGSEDRNVLGWARVQYEDVGGKKVAHVIEVQSDWGQERREHYNTFPDAVVKPNGDGTWSVFASDKPRADEMQGPFGSKEEAQRSLDNDFNKKNKDHPLLRDYNRLVLKAAIDQARKDGASHIALSDAETAMMSEGHDLIQTHDNERRVPGIDPPQAAGMRLNYSKILPDIMEKLTGSKGEKVSFGEHQRAFLNDDRVYGHARVIMDTKDKAELWLKNQTHINPSDFTIKKINQGWAVIDKDQYQRQNLIFKNPDGTSKTDASGLLYNLGKVKEARETKPYTYFGKDEPEKLFSGVSLQQVNKTFNDLKAHLITREQAAQALDAADNVAKVAGRQRGNRVMVSLPDKLDRQALTFVVESGGDKTKLQTYATQVAGKNKTAEAAIARAQSDLARLKPHADQVSQWIEEQRKAEVAKGIEADYLTNYMKHAYDMEDTGWFNSGPGGSGVSTSFLKPRTFPDYATAIENGFKPRNLDAAKLLESRVAAGQKLMNRETWGEGLTQLKDTKGNPFATALVKDKGRLLAPEGYERMELSPGTYMAINKEYKDLISALTGESFVRQSKLGRGLLKTGAVIKHSMLAFDLYHASRMMRREFFLNGRVGYDKGVSLLEYDKPTIQRLVARGDIKPETAKWIDQNRPIADLLMKKGLNVGRLTDALFAEVVSKPINYKGKDLNIIGHTQRWVFDKLTRGAMLESALIEIEKVMKQNPTWTREQAASHTAKQMNVYYGNLSRQGVFKSETFRDMLQIGFLAPQWVESMTQSEARGYKQIAQTGVDAVTKRRLQIGSLGKAMTAGIVGSMVAAQIVNLATTGKPTWKNDEGHKLDAKLPGGYYVSPLNDMAEMTHDYLKYGEKGKSPLETTGQIVANKMSPIMRAEETLRTGKDYSGAKLNDHDRIKETVKALDPRPLFISGLGSEVPKQGGKQAYSLLGLKVEPDFRMHEEALEAKSGKKFDEMSLEDRLIAERQVDSERSVGDDKAKLKATERSMELQAQRGQEMVKKLDRADRGWLESRSLQLPGYDSKVVFTKADTGFDKPTSVYLTKEETKRYGQIMLEHYKAGVDLLREDYDKLEDNETKKDYYASVMKEVRGLAREQMKEELLDSKNESDKKGK